MMNLSDTLKNIGIAVGGGGAMEIVHNTPVSNEQESLYKLLFQGILFLMALIPLADRVITHYINKRKKTK
jgi:hypothetical protein